MEPSDVLVVFPEGGNFTPGRRRAVAKLRRRGLRESAQRAGRLHHVLPPRPAGVFAAIDAARGVAGTGPMPGSTRPTQARRPLTLTPDTLQDQRRSTQYTSRSNGRLRMSTRTRPPSQDQPSSSTSADKTRQPNPRVSGWPWPESEAENLTRRPL
jgi:hypothetical protein